jgi:GTP cyclohydrolase II
VIDRQCRVTGLGTPLMRRSTCGPQLREAVERIAKHGGYVLYMRQEGRGIGLYDKLDAYALPALHLTGTNAAYLATKARRGGHDLLSLGLERAAEPPRHSGPAHLGTEGR